MHNEHWLTSTAFSPFGAPWTNEVTKGICIQVQRCSKPTHDHAESEISIDNHQFENEDSVPLPLQFSNPQSQKM